MVLCLMLESANDAAVAIEIGVAGSEEAFVDEMNIAPEFSVDFNTLPADFALGNIYTAQWLQVVGTVDGYTRSKDMISIQFAEQTLDNTAITQLRSDVCVALSDILDKRLNVLFYPFCIISFLVVIVGELAVIRISGVLTEKYFKPTEWDYLQESIDARTASKVRNTLDFTDELAVLHTMAMRFTKRTRQTNVQTQQLTTYKDSVAKKEHDMSTQDIVLKQSGFEQTKKKAMQRPAKKIRPIQEDILLDSSLLAKKRL